MHQILPDTGDDRTLLPFDVDSVDTLVVSLHPHLLREFSNAPYEAAALLWLVLLEAEQHHPKEKSKVRNFQLGFMAAPAYFLTPGELMEEVDRLAARGVVERVGGSSIRLNPAAVCLIEYKQVPARRRLEWNTERAAWAGSAMPTFPSA
ncbi:hypothetical protein [Streptomyces goshikiensis]|uniref:hypothetical protein n=1 Tax=Streptomyces goshikiensis TaxID=1942 RepID=UPI002ADFBCAF|nr:hypothetical protein [Streptomyces goshikiensis]